jgi:F0F1-type ATP synthase membrane subunit b/b'
MEFGEIVSFIFRVLNFAALAALVIYIFRSRFLAQMKSKIREKEVFWQNLKNNKTTLVKQQKELDEEIAWQDSYAQELLAKINKWHEQVHILYDLEKKKHSVYSLQIEQRALTQEKYYQLQILVSHVAACAFQRAQEDLSIMFSDETKASAYLDKLIMSLQKSKQ